MGVRLGNILRAAVMFSISVLEVRKHRTILFMQ
ncbi:hypothetical protein J2S21_001886 [Peribacillus cavernae]|nr:hypothetical protein [Peribacillus cavernae]